MPALRLELGLPGKMVAGADKRWVASSNRTSSSGFPMIPPSVISPEGQNVTFVELFFDLVFVFSLTQIVGILHDGITWQSVGEASLAFWLVWWGWTQFTWALNAANTDHAGVQFFTLLASGVAFFMAVSVPAAFGDGAFWFAISYVLVRVIGLMVYLWVAGDAGHRAAVLSFATLSTGGLLAVLLGASLGGALQYWAWGGAILLDVVAASVGGRQEAWNLHASHFVERHGLIVIIALGESLIVAASGLVAAPTDPALITAAVLSVGLACALWWSYFPHVRPALERAMEHAPPARQGALARDVFSLAHFPMLSGVIGVAAGIEEAILHPGDPLPLGGRLALGLGLILFLGGSSVATWRALGTLPIARLGIAVVTGLGIVGMSGFTAWGSILLGVAGILVLVLVEERGKSLESTGFKCS